jgi:hypothetical protein
MDVQSMRASILDELVFAPSEIPELDPMRNQDRSIALGVRDSARRLRIGSPWFVRGFAFESLGKSWSALCGLLRAADIPIYASCESLEVVPAAAIPKRYAKRFSNEPLVTLELKTADAFELDCRSRASLQWAWPAEFDSASKLATFVSAVRSATGGTTPVGISLPVGASKVDLQKCDAAKADFVVLIDDSGSLNADAALVLSGLAATHPSFIDAQQPNFPIFLVADPRNIEAAIKLLALGATAVSLDTLLRDAMTIAIANAKDKLTLGGMMLGISGAQEQKLDLEPVAQLIESLNNKLDWQMNYANVRNLGEFNSAFMRASTERASRLAGVRLLRCEEQ